MDIISHGLWGGGLFGRSKKIFWIAFIIGILPDFLAFAVPSISRILAYISGNGVPFSAGQPYPDFPQYVHSIYNVTHSLLIFGAVFLTVWAIRKKPYIPLLAWGFHVFIDIFTHTKEFFPTPFLWPVSDFHVDGISWGTPVIFLSNLVALTVLYVIIYIKKRKNQYMA